MAGLTPRLRSLLLNLAVAVVALGLGGLACEAVLRFAFRDVTTTPDYSSALSRRWRSELRLDADGFRERDLKTAAAEPAYRIVVLGDSFAFGQGIGAGERFSDLLEAMLEQAEPDRSFQVLNLGRPGAETDDQLEILRSVALPLHPDFIVLQWYQNDVELSDKSGRPRALPLVPVQPVAHWLHAHSVLYYLLRDQWSALQKRMGWIDSYEHYMQERFSDADGPAARAAADAMAELVAECRRNDLPLAVILFPDLVGPGPLDFLRLRAQAQLEAAGVPVIDMAPVFFAHDDLRPLWANRLDRHPGNLAHREAAEALWERFGSEWLQAARAGSAGGVMGKQP